MEETGPYESVLKLFQLYLDAERTDRDFSALFHKIYRAEKPGDVQEKKPGKTDGNLIGSLTAKEVIPLLRISIRTLFNYRKTGKLTSSFIGGKHLYRKEDVEKLID